MATSLLYINGAYVPMITQSVNGINFTLPNTPTIISPVDSTEINGDVIKNTGKANGKVLTYNSTNSDIEWSVVNATEINGNVVDDSSKEDGRVLSYSAYGGTLEWVESSNALANTTLDYSNNGQTLSTTYDIYFIAGFEGFTVNLPDPSTMTGRELTFLTVESSYESSVNVYGLINGSDNNFSLNGFSSVKLISNGSGWFITATYSS